MSRAELSNDVSSSPGGSEFQKLVRSPLKFRAFLIRYIPAAWFSGVRVRSVDENGSVVTVPFKWFTTNPFRSTYFACLAMAAEMSTGILGMAQVHGRNPAVSMLIISLDGEFIKKATDVTTFVCNDGEKFREAVDKCISTGEAQQVNALSVGTNKSGEEVARFHFTWSFKVKSRK